MPFPSSIHKHPRPLPPIRVIPDSHPLFDSSVEQTNLDLQWDNSANIINTALGGDEAEKGHYQSCNPTQCEFVEDER